MLFSEILCLLLLSSIASSTFIEFVPFEQDSDQGSAASFFYADVYSKSFNSGLDLSDIEVLLNHRPCLMMDPSYPDVHDQMNLYATCDYKAVDRFKFTLNPTERKSVALVSGISKESNCFYNILPEFYMSWKGINYTVRSEESGASSQKSHVRLLQYQSGWNYDQIRSMYPIINNTEFVQFGQSRIMDCACLNSSPTSNQMKIWHSECEGTKSAKKDFFYS